VEGQFIYEDFDLLVEPGSSGSYRARVLRSPAGESAPVQFTLPFAPWELENFMLLVGRPRRGTRGAGRPESTPLKDFGGKLYDAVFQAELRDILLSSLSQTRAQGIGMRLRLRLTGAPELTELPWEFLYDRRLNRFLARSHRTPLVRYLELPDPPRPLRVEGPLRLLVMISAPSGYPGLDVEHEWDVLTRALAEQQAHGQVILKRLDANMIALQERLRREAFHVFHFVGHGFYRPDWRDGVLVMEDRNGLPHEVPGEELGGLLSEHDSTRLAVLNACEGGRSGAGDPFSGVAQSLIQQGLPAVVAMQFEITDDAAITFAHGLYGAIADGYSLEAALAEARLAILHEGNPTEWGTPVLYSRAPDGRLFELTPGSDTDRRVEATQGAAAGPRDEQRTKRAGIWTAADMPEPRVMQLRSVWGHIAISPDGTRLATGHLSRTRIWDVQSGAPLRELRTNRGLVAQSALVFSPDGSRLASAADDNTARIWDVATGLEQLRVTHGHVPRPLASLTSRSSVKAVAFSPDGTRLATASVDKTARIWDATTTGLQQLQVRHDDSVGAVAFSPDGTRLATASKDKTARIWDARTGQQQLQVRHDDSVNAVVFSPDGTRLATSSVDKTARIWDAATGEPQFHAAHGGGGVGKLVFSPDGTRLATVCQGDRTVRIWDASTGQQLFQMVYDDSWNAVTAFSPDGTRLATASGTIARIWDLSGG
jgi:WD40 repeat protein